MVWAQAFPFVALQLVEGDTTSMITIFLIVSFVLWLLSNISFLCTINPEYVVSEMKKMRSENEERSDELIVTSRPACCYRSYS